MGDSLDHVSSVLDQPTSSDSGGVTFSASVGTQVSHPPPPQISPVGSAGGPESKRKRRRCCYAVRHVGFQNYGWIYAGRVAFGFSCLILLAAIVIWVLAIKAIQHYNSPDCIVPLTISEVDSPVPLQARCRTGYVPIGQGIFLTVFSLINFVVGLILAFNPNRLHLWASLCGNLINITTVGCLTLFDLVLNTQYRSLWSMHTSERTHANRISDLFLYEGIMAALLLFLHLVSLFLTLLSLLQPCEENCLEAKCTSRHASSHASTPSHIKEFNATTHIEDTTI